jgi:hypothetical protein
MGWSYGKKKEKSPSPMDEGFGGRVSLASGQGNKYMTMSPIAAIRTDQVAKTMN